jgi:hypothetical protein
MYAGKILRHVRQLPVILGWRIAIFIACKSSHLNIVVCDVTCTQSKHRDRFVTDVKWVLDDLAVRSPELLQRMQQRIRYIARAEITNRFEYFSSPRLLLVCVDYEHADGDLRNLIKGDIVEAAHLIQASI